MSSRSTGEGAEKVYAAASQWVKHALQADSSLFTPGKPIWSSQWLSELRTRYLNQPDETSDDFYTKLERQLAGSPAEVYQLMAEVLYMNFLFVHESSMKGATKRRRINQVLAWSNEGGTIPENPSDGLAPGLGGVGQAFFRSRPWQVGFLIEFAERWKEESSDTQKTLLDDPWAFKNFLQFTPTSDLFQEVSGDGSYRMQRDALLHLTYPDTFERVFSLTHKKRIAEAYANLLDETIEDIDGQLQQIRRGIQTELGRDFDFYEDPIRRRWDPSARKRASDQPLVQKEDQPLDPSPPVPSRQPDLEVLAAELLLPVDFLQRIDSLLKEKGQVIFQGPPGTGKTYVAQELAACLAGSKKRVTLVQFHPSYAYEDFVQGFRPTLTGSGQAGFKLTDGPLLTAAKRARDEEDEDHFLVIDEINRGNLAKILGELYFLLEYRDKEVTLQYGDDSFSLPKNMYIIGTMNTADRSIALVDLALRRRFYFVEFHPDDEPIKGLLRRWLEKNAPSMEWVADVVKRANRKLADDRHVAIGPSYFMGTDEQGKAVVQDETTVSRIWKHSVLPYIEEHLFGNLDGLGEWQLDKLRKKSLARGQQDENAEAETSEAADASD